MMELHQLKSSQLTQWEEESFSYISNHLVTMCFSFFIY